MNVLKLISLVVISIELNSVFCVETSRVLEGYPTGMLGNCVGTTKPAKITQRSLKKLFLIHFQGGFLSANMTQYNYYQMEKLAKRLDLSKKTVLYMNGYLDSSFMNVITPAMGSVYSDLGYNVLLLEYVQVASFEYPKACRILPAVGQRAAEMLAALVKHGLDRKSLEIVGISFGGQGISFIAKSFRKITGKNLTRISGIDPAGPCFRRLGPEHRIDASDADFVDILHTNNDGYGYAGAVGHVDFYVNGGEYQFMEMPEYPCGGLCSHLRSYTIWVAALNYPDSFIGVKCDSVQDARDKTCFKKPLITNVVGSKVNKDVQGIFYVATTNTYPYFMGKKGLGSGHDLSVKYMEMINAADMLIV